MKKLTYQERVKNIEELIPNYKTVRDFYIENPYLYKWALKNGVDMKKYFPKKSIHCKYDDRANKGIDCYKVGSKKLYKHYPFIMDALRDLDLTYYYVHKVLDGELESIDGYTFVKCE